MMNHHQHAFDAWVQQLHEQAEIHRTQAEFLREQSAMLREQSAALRERRRRAFERAANLLEQRLQHAAHLARFLTCADGDSALGSDGADSYSSVRRGSPSG